MTQEQRLSQVEELLADQMHKQDYIYEEVLTLKGNLDKMNSAVGTLVKTSRIMNGDVTFVLNKTNVIVDKVTEIDERVERVETKIDNIEKDIVEMKGDIVEMKGDIVEMKGDMNQVKGLLTKILEKIDK
jgi:chromosome segregation ATPase